MRVENREINGQDTAQYDARSPIENCDSTPCQHIPVQKYRFDFGGRTPEYVAYYDVGKYLLIFPLVVPSPCGTVKELRVLPPAE